MMDECEAEMSRLHLTQKITKLQRSLLANAKSEPLNAMALKEAGLVFLYAMELPQLGLKYFEVCRRLDPDNDEYQKLTERAKQAVLQSQEAPETGLKGRATTRHLVHSNKQKLPTAASVIRKSGKIPTVSKSTAVVQQRLAQDRKNRALDPSHDRESGATLLEHAEHALEQRDIDQADLLVRHALKREGDPILAGDLLMQIGDGFFQKAEYASAQECYHDARNLEPGLMVAWFNEALSWQKLGGFDEALRCNTKACDLEPENARIWANFSTIHFELEHFAQSEMTARRATELQPDYPRAWDNLAGALAAQQKYTEAIACAQKALQLKPEFPELWFKLGVLLFNEGRLEESRQAFLKSREFEQGANYATTYLILILVHEGNLQEAVQSCEEAQRQDPNLPLVWLAWNNIALAFVEKKDYERATWAGRLAVKFGRGECEAWLNLGYAYHLAGQLTDAQDAYELALQINTESASGWHNLGLVCRELHELRRATHAFQKVVEIEPQNASAWKELANALEREGDRTQAGMARDRALELLREQARSVKEETQETKGLFQQLKGVFKK
jgi:tetratricopeptide (TPR) repeat protein